ncbi:hypothetical protein BCO18430_01124 [Burkholderia contaminans]|nr:hypothetical protein BCO18430_01124 [Burkholderia contaminans]
MAPCEEAGRHRPANAITSNVITISRHFCARPRASRHTRFEIAAQAIALRRRERLPRVASTRAARCRGRPTRRHCRGRAPAAGRCAPATRRADAAGRARHNSRTAVASRPASARTLRRDAPALRPDRPHRAVTAVRPTGAAPADDRVPPRAPQRYFRAASPARPTPCRDVERGVWHTRVEWYGPFGAASSGGRARKRAARTVARSATGDGKLKTIGKHHPAAGGKR